MGRPRKSRYGKKKRGKKGKNFTVKMTFPEELLDKMGGLD